jgi:ATP-dependent RNA helicase DeaD
MVVEYATTAAESRLATLRRILDELDPASSVVFARDSESELRVRDLLRSLGYSRDDAAVRVGLTAAPGTDLVVLFDMPASREELREAAGAANRVIALIQPRQLSSLRALAAGGSMKPFVLRDSADRARDRDARILSELRESLQEAHFGRELMALEPLLADYDGAEIAAAALQLLERERVRSAAAVAAVAAGSGTSSTSRERPTGPMVRLFVNVGARDNARPGDLVGAITNQGGVTSADVGKVDVRESHSIVEVSPSVADDVIERVTGSSIRGRRAVVRRDEERPRREARTGDRGGSGRGDRSPRAAGAPRPGQSRGGDRGTRPPRGTPRRDGE